MKLSNDRNITKTYQKMGIKYLQDIEKITPPGFLSFLRIIRKGGRVLDVGCAGGRDCGVFARRGFKVVGVDLVDVFLKEAKKLAPKAKFVRMDLLNLKFPTNYFDAIWANAVLHHVNKKDLPAIFRGFYRALKPGGKLYIQTKQGQSLVYRKDKFSRRKRPFLLLLKKDLVKYALLAGFKIRFIKTVNDAAKRKSVKWLALLAEKK